MYVKVCFPLLNEQKRSKTLHSSAVRASKDGRDGFRGRDSMLPFMALSGRFQWHPFHTQLNPPSMANSPNSD